MSGARPRSLRAFQWVVYLECLLAFVGTYLFWLTRRDIVDPSHAPPRFAFYYVTVIVLFTLFLAWLITRRASNVGKWIYVALSGLGFLGLLNVRRILEVGALYAGVSFAQIALMAISLGLLFRRDAREWFAGRRPVDPEVFR
jgi:hypothetical protein